MKNSKTFTINKTFGKLLAMLAVLIVAVMPIVGCAWIKPEEPSSYTVTFDSDGGSAVTAQHVLPGELATEPKDPKNGNYEFVGWYKDAKLTTLWNFDTDRVNANITLYAKWRNPTPDVPGETYYTVTFDSNGGSAVEPKQVKSGDLVAMPADPTRDGYDFVCWCADSGLTDEWIFGVDTVTSHIRLYAKWKEQRVEVDPPSETYYTVTFNSTGGSAVESKQVKSGEIVTKPTDPTRDGYDFICWCTDSTLETEWNFATATVGSNTTLYAKWNSRQAPETYYSVTFNSNGGSAVAQKQVKSGGLVTKPTDPTRDGYDFVCWCKDSALATEWNFATDTVGSNTTLYAKWNARQTPPTPSGNGATVTFNVGLEARKEGVSNPPAQKANNGKITEPTVTRNGYTLTGWYVDNGSTKWNFSTSTVTTETTLFAKWQRGTGSTGGNNSATIGGGTTVEYTPDASLTTAGKIYIHYLRTDSNYSDWKIHTWVTGGNGKQFTSKTVDKSGTVFEITPSEIGLNVSDSNATLNFIVAIINGDNWNKDGGDNAAKISDMANISGSYHWFVQQGNTNNGSNKLTISGSNNGKVDRSYARNLPVANNPTGWDETGVGYQIFVASFCDSNGDGAGDLQGIISKLDYLESLSVDVLWLTPIQSSDSYHGYDCYDYYAIDPKFGTNADYRELVYKAHLRGMKVLMDLVVNHTSTRNEWFLKSKAGTVETVTYQDGSTQVVDYGQFYRWKSSGGTRYYSGGNGKYYYSSFNDTMPELNYDYQPARDAMTDVAMYWMAYGLDGFRMDAIKHMFMWDESENDPSGDQVGDPNGGEWKFNMTKNVEWFKEFNYRLKTKYPNCFLLGENLTGDPTYIAPFYAGMDSLFDFNTYYNLPTRISGGDGGAAAVASTFNDNAAKYAAARNGVGRAINGMISSNHDIDRLSYKLGDDTAKIKLYMSVIMTMPGCHWIYYGDEIGLRSVEKTGTMGDDTYRQSMKWTSDWANKCTKQQDYACNNNVASVAEQSSNSGSLLATVRAIAKVRNDNPALISGTATCSASDGVLKITVRKGSTTIVAYHNFNGTAKTISQSGTAVYGSTTLGAYGSAVFRV